MPTTVDAIRLAITDVERSQGRLEAERLEVARQAVLGDGFVVLDDLLPLELVDQLAARMHAEVPALVETATLNPNRYSGQLQQRPPSEPEYLFPEVLANPIVLALCRSVLGDSIGTVLYEGNTNMPGSVAQAIHCDLPQLWPDLDPVPASPYGLIANLCLVDTTNENATELWPGTHLDGRTYTRAGMHRDIPKEWLDARRHVRPPIQVPQKQGSVIVRDIRMWHGAVANTSGQVRIMVGVGYAPSWYNGFSIPVPDSVAAVLTHLGVPPTSTVDGSLAFVRQIAQAYRASS